VNIVVWGCIRVLQFCKVWYSVLQCVAAWCSVLQCGAVCCSVLQRRSFLNYIRLLVPHSVISQTIEFVRHSDDGVHDIYT